MGGYREMVCLFFAKINALGSVIKPCLNVQLLRIYSNTSKVIPKAFKEWTTVYKTSGSSPKLFVAISTIAGLQLVFWGYLSYFALTELDHVDKRSQSQSQSQSPLMSSFKLRVVVSLVSLGAGLFFAVSAFLYPLRIVRRFCVSSDTVRLVTATPWGGCREFTVPLSHVTCSTSRLAGSTRSGVFGVKVKGHAFYYLLDHQVLDRSPQVRLFDRLIATRQTIR